MPFCRSSFARLRKKLTVIGMIGHIHGITSASNPPTIPKRNIYISEWFAMSLLPPSCCSSLITGFQRASLSASVRLAAVKESAFAIESAFASAILSAFSLASSSGFPAASAKAVCSFVSAVVSALAPTNAGLFPLLFISTDVGGIQFLSLHAPYSRYASIV